MIRFLLLALLFSGTVYARGSYWVKTFASVPVMAVAEVEDTTAYCGAYTAGCFRRDIGVVYLLKGMPPSKRACVLGHEALSPKSHANGWDHPEFNERGYGFDCGDGTMWIPPMR